MRRRPAPHRPVYPEGDLMSGPPPSSVIPPARESEPARAIRLRLAAALLALAAGTVALLLAILLVRITLA
jgi:hypothetical protein